MIAKYFDGKSSKAHRVNVMETMGGLKIESLTGEGYVSRFWKMEDISTESFSTGQKVLLNYGDFPFERLEITGEGADRFIDNLKHHESKLKGAFHFITRTGPVKLVIGSLALLGIVLYSYIFWISPFVGEQAVKFIPKEVEMKAGEIMYKNMEYMVDVDSTKSERLMEFYQACGFQSEYDIRIDYSKEDMVNAFAVPGGQMVIYEGLIRETESWDELAALMGHELAHVNQRHSFKQIARGISSYFLISVLTGDVAGASSVILENAAQIYELSNSRAHEKEADVIGLEYLREIQVRPEAMIDLFERLQQSVEDMEEEVDITISDRVESGMEYLQTHPAVSNRMKYIRELIDSDENYQYQPKEIDRAEAIWLDLKSDLEGTENENPIKVIKEKIGLGKNTDQ